MLPDYDDEMADKKLNVLSMNFNKEVENTFKEENKQGIN